MDNIIEVWKPIPNHNNHYEASSLGNIRVKDRYIEKPNNLPNQTGVSKQLYKGRLLKLSKAGSYLRVTLGYNNQYKSYPVHRLVAYAFIGLPPLETYFCCHKDGNPTNNKPENLYWGTHTDNMSDRKKHGNYAKGVNHHFSKYSEDFISKVKRLSRKEALELGVSNTHYYRIRNGER